MKLGVCDVGELRLALGLSRSEFSRFLGVSEATVVRWESSPRASQPRGLQAVLLNALADALSRRSRDYVADVVRAGSRDHRQALKALLDAAAE